MVDKVVVTKEKLSSIGDAIRNGTGETNKYKLDEIPNKINSIISHSANGSQITVITREQVFYGLDVSITNGVQTITSKFSDEGVCVFNGVPWEGELIVFVNYKGLRYVTTVMTKIAYDAELKYSLASWADATDEQLKNMISGYYAGVYSLDDIQSVWHIGDTRTIHLSAMSPAYQLSDSHREQDVEMVILDFEHDNLTTPINSKTKALITIQQKDCLMDAECAAGTKFGENNTENGAIGLDYYTQGDYNTFPRTLWLRDTYYNALPASFRNLLKETTRKWGNQMGQYGSRCVCDEKVFLPSIDEMATYGGYTDIYFEEQSLYPYYVVPPNYRIAPNLSKKPLWTSDAFSSVFHSRTSLRTYNYNFIGVMSDGTKGRLGGTSLAGLAPAMCL